MALPEGVTTCTVTAGVPVSHTGAPVKAFLSIEPSVFLVHTATGTPLVDFLEELSINEGVAGQFTLPHTDQAGFQDENGNAYTNWYYTARISYSTPSKAKTKAPKIKVFQLATGQTLVDLDSLPGGAPALPYTAPIATVTSVNGRTGTITIEDGDLPERLSDASLTATILSEVEAPIEAAVTPVAAKVNNRPKLSDGIFAAISEALKSGRSAAVQEQGDSTGNSPYEWVYLTTQWMASQHPDCHVKYKLWNDTTQGYDGWTTVQAGTSGERHAVFLGSGLSRTFYTPQAAIPHIAGDIDIRVRLAMNDWTPAATAGIVTRYGAAGARAWKLSINTGGAIDFTWTTDGTTNIQKVSTAVGFADGTEGWVRITLDVDNGSGGYTWKAYKSTDGVTWTEIGSSVDTTSGATSIFNATQEYEIGGRGFVGEPWAGKMYEVQIRDGIAGKIVNPQPIDSWVPRILSGGYAAGTFGGSPTLYVLNGSMPGANYTYFTDAARHPKMVHPYAGSLLFQSCSHNDGDNTGAAYLAARDAWLALNDARVPGSQTVLVTQNPQQAPIGAELINNQARRRLLLMSWAARKGIATIDTYKAFREDPRGLSALLETDGIHPNTVGSQLWADTVTGAFAAAV